MIELLVLPILFICFLAFFYTLGHITRYKVKHSDIKTLKFINGKFVVITEKRK